MKYILCILLAYLIGSLSPAALISKIKHTDLNKDGTGKLGATNVAAAFGRVYGLIVMVFDVLKGFFAVKIANLIVPGAEWIALLVGFFAIIGHCFPFYLKFKGGKGLAAFGGVILAYNPIFFLIAFISGLALVLIFNTGTALVYYVALMFPIFVGITSKNVLTTTVCILMSLFMMIYFIPNLMDAILGKDHKSRDFLKRDKKKELNIGKD